MMKRNLVLAAVLVLVAAALVLWMTGRPSAPVVQEAPREIAPMDVSAEAPAGSTVAAQGPEAAQATTLGASADPSVTDRAPELPAVQPPVPGSPQEQSRAPELEALPTPSGQPVREELIRVPSDAAIPAERRPEIEFRPGAPPVVPNSAGELVGPAAPGQGDTSTR
jgi:hypothetical protein